MQHKCHPLERAVADAARGAREDAHESFMVLTGEARVAPPDRRSLHHALRRFDPALKIVERWAMKEENCGVDPVPYNLSRFVFVLQSIVENFEAPSWNKCREKITAREMGITARNRMNSPSVRPLTKGRCRSLRGNELMSRGPLIPWLSSTTKPIRCHRSMIHTFYI